MKIKKPQFYTTTLAGEELSVPFITKCDFGYWFDLMFGTAVEVYSYKSNDDIFYKVKNPVTPTHKALLINIEPIKRESAKDVLRDLIADAAYMDDGLLKRAKAVLEEK